jgi:hypothetical protein
MRGFQWPALDDDLPVQSAKLLRVLAQIFRFFSSAVGGAKCELGSLGAVVFFSAPPRRGLEF